jgi:hypothetical protein
VARRQQLGRLAALARRTGFGLFAAAVVGVVVAVPAGLPGWLVAAVVVALVVGSVLLAPALVIGFGVRAAEREDRQGRP